MSDTNASTDSYLNSHGLTKKQEAFARAVITQDNYSDAYRLAYDAENMTPKTVNEEASRLVSDHKIATRIAELRDRAEKAADVTLDRWFREQARIAYSDPKELFNDDGSMKQLSEMSADARAAIASIDTEIRMAGSDDNAEPITVKKVRLHSKTNAQDSIGRALGAYEKDNKQKGDIIPVIVNAPEWLGDDG